MAWFFRSEIGGIAIALAAGIVGLIVLYRAVPSLKAKGKPEAVVAKITKIHGLEGKYGRGMFRVYAEAPDAVSGYVDVWPAEIARCNVGDRIMAEQRGITIALLPRPCPIPAGGSKPDSSLST